MQKGMKFLTSNGNLDLGFWVCPTMGSPISTQVQYFSRADDRLKILISVLSLSLPYMAKSTVDDGLGLRLDRS